MANEIKPCPSDADITELVTRLNWWGAKRKAPRGMDSLPADCRAAAEALTALRARVKELEEGLGRVHRDANDRSEKAAYRLEMISDELHELLKGAAS